MLFPTGDQQGKNIAFQQPVTLAAMEGFVPDRERRTAGHLRPARYGAASIGQSAHRANALSFLTYQRWGAEVKGLDAFPREIWPDNIPLLYYSYHIMVGLGTIFIAVMALAAIQLARGAIYTSQPMLWTLMLALPFPYIATTAAGSPPRSAASRG